MAVAVAVAVSGNASCQQQTFEPASKIDTLRVLAVRADKPFAMPGDRVHLDALVADPKGGGRAVQIAWGTCVNPGSGEVTACGDAVASFAVGGSSFDFNVPSDALAGLPFPAGSVGVVFAACGGGTIVPVRTATSPVSCVDASGNALGRDAFMWGEKRIVVVPVPCSVSKDACNANPSIATVKLDQTPWEGGDLAALATCGAAKLEDCTQDQRHGLEAVASADSAETYHDPTGAQFTEDLVAFFYASDGSVQDDFVRVDPSTGSFLTVIAPTQVDPGTLVDVWVVLRDDRGGVDWRQRTYRVR